MSKGKRLREQRQGEQADEQSSPYPAGALSYELKPLDASLDEGRAQVARWTLRPVPIIPGKEMRANFIPTLHVRFDAATPIVGGAAVLDILGEVRDYIRSAVLPPLVGFLQ